MTDPQIRPREPDEREREVRVRAEERAVRPAERPPGYYGQPVVKPPVWTWEIPVYFAVGGLAGGAAVLALPAAATGAPTLALWALLIAAAGGAIGAALLVADLGRPSRFINMLRVLKWRSPMSVGAWTLAAFTGLALVSALLVQLGGLGVLAIIAAALTGLFGAVLATYTGVLIGATAIPIWARHHRLLPVHFGVAGLGSAAALLELIGFGRSALVAIGYAVAIAETAILAWVELRRRGSIDVSLHRETAGTMMRAAGVIAGPAALLARLVGLDVVAAAAFLAGTAISRFAWVRAGRQSALDPRAALG